MQKLEVRPENIVQKQFDITLATTLVPINVYYFSQYLSAYNNLGRWVPGAKFFRVNPVTMVKCSMVVPPSSVRIGYNLTTRPAWIEQQGPIGAVGISLGQTGVSTAGSPGFSPDAKLENLAIIEAFARRNEAGFDGGVFFGELAETIHMLRSPLRSTVKLLSHKRWKDPRKVLGAGTDAWMEFRYGMRPFVSDVANIAALFQRRAFGLQRTVHVARSVKIGKSSWTGDGYQAVGKLTHYFHNSGARTVSYHAGLGYQKKHGFGALAHQYGMAVQDLPGLMWELTPLSFVADWFYNIGDWLRAITPNPSVTHLGGFCSRKIEDVVTHTVYKTMYGADWVPGTACAVATADHLYRVAAPTVPAMPVRKISTLGLARSIDSAILLLQRTPTAWKRMLIR